MSISFYILQVVYNSGFKKDKVIIYITTLKNTITLT